MSPPGKQKVSFLAGTEETVLHCDTQQRTRAAPMFKFPASAKWDKLVAVSPNQANQPPPEEPVPQAPPEEPVPQAPPEEPASPSLAPIQSATEA